jgi:hypothetical protein
MACGCNGSKSKINYQVRYKDGQVQVFATSQEATQAIRAAGGGSMKPVPAKG